MAETPPIMRLYCTAILLVILCSCFTSTSSLKKRADDPDTITNIEKLTQDQAALIQTLEAHLFADQMRLSEIESKLHAQANTTAQLEDLLRQQASQIQALEALITAAGSGHAGGAYSGRRTCPQDWLQFQTSCYAFGNERVTFGDAQEACEVFGGTLVEIGSQEENNFVRDHVIQTHESSWIGGTDILNEGHWVWIGSGVEINVNNPSGAFEDWYVNRPDDGGGHDPSQDCLTMYASHDYRWDDRPCDEKNTFVCELRLAVN